MRPATQVFAVCCVEKSSAAGSNCATAPVSLALGSAAVPDALIASFGRGRVRLSSC